MWEENACQDQLSAGFQLARLDDFGGTPSEQLTAALEANGILPAFGHGLALVGESDRFQHGFTGTTDLHERPLVHEIWEEFGSNTTLMWRGRLLCGPRRDLWHNFLTWGVLLVPCAFFLVFCAGPLCVEVGHWLPVLVCGLLASTGALLALTSMTDPGIMPNAGLQMAVPGLQAEVAARMSTPYLAAGMVAKHLSAPVLDRGITWCKACHIPRAPRTSHCSRCNCCVVGMDHHCPYVRNCIGVRNYAFFLALLANASALGAAVVAGLSVWAAARVRSDGTVAIRAGAGIALAVVACVPSVLIAGLGVFHCLLVVKDRTSREMLAPAPLKTPATRRESMVPLPSSQTLPASWRGSQLGPRSIRQRVATSCRFPPLVPRDERVRPCPGDLR